MLDRAKI
jgi:hypothetical protein